MKSIRVAVRTRPETADRKHAVVLRIGPSLPHPATGGLVEACGIGPVLFDLRPEPVNDLWRIPMRVALPAMGASLHGLRPLSPVRLHWFGKLDPDPSAELSRPLMRDAGHR